MDLSPSQFFDFYVTRSNSSVRGSFYLTPRERRGIFVIPSKYSHRDANWQRKFFFFRVSPETALSLDAFQGFQPDSAPISPQHPPGYRFSGGATPIGSPSLPFGSRWHIAGTPGSTLL
ncbi:unnamed protein product [Arabis nemorensis]|uniref:Uncharacterized protein n=1 Tax=Arabis nemorensis TaxID=586526 RepID=A0A565ATR2_9BRAS|nr:unnamed protein product [Arabis nemorensis]